jgi:hypothetical protein
MKAMSRNYQREVLSTARRLLAVMMCVLVVALAVAFSLDSDRAGAAATVRNPYGAWVYADQPTTSAYIPAHNIQEGEDGRAVVVRDGVGTYHVDFPGAATSAGNASVGAVNSSSRTCQVANWGPVGTLERVSVACFDRLGARSDARFSVYFTDALSRDDAGPLYEAYLFADRADATVNSPYVPKHLYANVDSLPTVTRTGTGRYVVSYLTEPYARAAHVSAFGESAALCRVEQRSVTPRPTPTLTRPKTPLPKPELRITVQCTGPTGVAKNTRFSLHYGPNNNNHVWAVNDRPSEPLNTTYVPANSEKIVTAYVVTGITRTAVGRYKVTFDLDFDTSLDALPLVTATGSTNGHCEVDTWSGGGTRGPDDWATISCYSAAGNYQDQPFHFSTLRRLGPL